MPFKSKKISMLIDNPDITKSITKIFHNNSQEIPGIESIASNINSLNIGNGTEPIDSSFKGKRDGTELIDSSNQEKTNTKKIEKDRTILSINESLDKPTLALAEFTPEMKEPEKTHESLIKITNISKQSKIPCLKCHSECAFAKNSMPYCLSCYHPKKGFCGCGQRLTVNVKGSNCCAQCNRSTTEYWKCSGICQYNVCSFCCPPTTFPNAPKEKYCSTDVIGKGTYGTVTKCVRENGKVIY